MFKTASVRKALILLSMGGATFAWGGFLGGLDPDISFPPRPASLPFLSLQSRRIICRLCSISLRI